jgi:hypothetical protein
VVHRAPDPYCVDVPAAQHPGCNHREPPPQADARGAAPADPKTLASSPQLEAYVQQHVAAIECCYSKGRRRNPRLEGRVIAGWTIEPSGGVSDYWTVQSTLASQVVTDCIGDVICGWQFPAREQPRGDVLWSFVFKD